MMMLLCLWALCLTTILTAVILRGHGVNAHNHGLFVKMLRLKMKHASTDEIGNALFEHLMNEIHSRRQWQGAYDIAPVEHLLTERAFNDAVAVLVGKLLSQGFKPVSIDHNGFAKVLIG